MAFGLIQQTGEASDPKFTVIVSWHKHALNKWADVKFSALLMHMGTSL